MSDPTKSGHISVSNLPEDPDFPQVLVSEFEAPELGEGTGAGQGTNDGREAVEVPPTAEAVAIVVAPDTSNLSDIGEASFGPAPPLAETVHGPDDRVRINNTTVYPWRVHSSLLITARDNSRWIGTGLIAISIREATRRPLSGQDSAPQSFWN